MVAEVLRVCLAFYIITFGTVQLLATLPPCACLHILKDGGRCGVFILLSIIEVRLKVVDPLYVVVGSLRKRYAATVCVWRMPTPALEDRHLEDVCAICMEAMDADEARLTPCGHAFHGPCLKLSLGVTPDCPMCRGHLL